ncbi:MAG: hypothetical protein KAI67_03095 [Candidatus Pacebacteria bacterium]|nr:hypothetical protein [Candidatus Paceibacterota bacterium]
MYSVEEGGFQEQLLGEKTKISWVNGLCSGCNLKCTCINQRMVECQKCKEECRCMKTIIEKKRIREKWRKKNEYTVEVGPGKRSVLSF